MTKSTPTLTLTQTDCSLSCCDASATQSSSWPGVTHTASTCVPPFGRSSLGHFVRLRHERSSTTPGAGNRFTTTCGSNTPNGSSQMVNPPCASWNCSTL